MRNHLSIFLFYLMVIPGYSCTRDDIFYLNPNLPDFDSLSLVEVIVPSASDGLFSEGISIDQYASLSFAHQSAAVYDNYALLVTDGRMQMCLYNLQKKKSVYLLSLKGYNRNVYHCNQSSFGVDKYDPSDFFPLLYISQRATSSGRCFLEVFRIITHYDDEIQDFDSFNVELVQTIFLPRMTYDNSMGNANCAIDSGNKLMYVYSRNNDSDADNYEQCKITQFAIPDIHKKVVSLEDENILYSFMIDASALYMQGGSVHDGFLYIGQGDPVVGYVYLNVVDLDRHELVLRLDLLEHDFKWEPEGCFFYDGSVMLSHTRAISRITGLSL